MNLISWKHNMAFFELNNNTSKKQNMRNWLIRLLLRHPLVWSLWHQWVLMAACDPDGYWRVLIGLIKLMVLIVQMVLMVMMVMIVLIVHIVPRQSLLVYAFNIQLQTYIKQKQINSILQKQTNAIQMYSTNPNVCLYS